LRGPEAVSWLNEESDFKKPIVKRSSDDSYHDNSSDDSYHDNSSDDNLTEPEKHAKKHEA